MDQQPADNTPGRGAGWSTADKIDAATQLLRSVFQDAHTDSATLSKTDLLAQIVATQELANITWAVQSARLAQVAATEEVLVSDTTSPDGVREHVLRHPIGTHQEEFIGSEIGPLLGWSPRQATDRITEATDLITRTPRLFARVGTGELEPGKVAGIHRAMGRVLRWRTDDGDVLDADLAGAVENGLLGDPDAEDGPESGSPQFAAMEQAKTDLLARSTTTQAARRTRRILATLDPVAADRAATRRRRSVLDEALHASWQPGAIMSTGMRRRRRRWKNLPNWRLVRYADDFVVLTDGTAADLEKLREEITQILAPMGLVLSPAKTSIVHMREGFDFLGFHIKWSRKKGTSKWHVYTFVGARPLRSVKAKIRALTPKTSQADLEDTLIRINQITRGWANYFRHAVATHTFNHLQQYTWWRIVRWQRTRHRWRWQDVRRWLTTPRGHWHPVTAGEVELFDPTRIPIRRYRYRGNSIPSPFIEATSAA